MYMIRNHMLHIGLCDTLYFFTGWFTGWQSLVFRLIYLISGFFVFIGYCSPSSILLSRADLLVREPMRAGISRAAGNLPLLVYRIGLSCASVWHCSALSPYYKSSEVIGSVITLWRFQSRSGRNYPYLVKRDFIPYFLLKILPVRTQFSNSLFFLFLFNLGNNHMPLNKIK